MTRTSQIGARRRARSRARRPSAARFSRSSYVGRQRTAPATPLSLSIVALRNADLADLIDRLGDLYELDGAVIYRVLAYRKAAARMRPTGESACGCPRRAG